MAMTADGLANAIYVEMVNTYEGMSDGEEETKKYLKVFAAGIVNYLKSNMDVIGAKVE
jgi:ABC-type Fe3+ transport system substrate-binding protein